MTAPESLPALLDQLTEQLAAATPGPWWVDRDRTNGFDIMRPDGDFLADRLGALSEADAALIVAAVNDLPRLTAIVRGLTDLADELETDASLGFDNTDAADRIRAVLNAGAEQ